jgi:GAF domain-containing protein/multidrug resistance efflux pump
VNNVASLQAYREHLSTLLELASDYHACRDVESLLKTFSLRVAAQLDAEAALVWLVDAASGGLVCSQRCSAAGVRFEPAPEPVTGGWLVEVLHTRRARCLPEAGGQLDVDSLAHLAENDRESVRSAIYAVLPGANGGAGVVEVLNKRHGEFTAVDATFLDEASSFTSGALSSLQAFEKERHSSLATIDRLTALYEISSTFNSTLELQELLPVVAEKIREILGARACNLWLVDRATSELRCVEQSGEYRVSTKGDRIGLGEGLIGQVGQQGEPRLVKNTQEEPLLSSRHVAAPQVRSPSPNTAQAPMLPADSEEGNAATREQGTTSSTVESVLCAPLVKVDQTLGVVEVVNRLDGAPFDEDDLFFLTSISEQAAIALHNANLLETERKVRALDALLAVSREITSTLNLDHVLATTVHQAATVVPFDRCVVGLFDRSRLVLGAVSGEAEVPQSPEMNALREILEEVATQVDPISADQYDEGWIVKVGTEEQSREEKGRRLIAFLEEHGYGGFRAIPLRDDQGAVGALALLSSDAEFLTDDHLEILGILANQVTLAIRNARLYQSVPLVKVWEPLAERRRKLLAATHGRWVELASKAAIITGLLIAVPWKMRVGANATVVPAERRMVTTEVAGLVKRVFVREARVVTTGTVLAELDASDDRVSLERAEIALALSHREWQEAEDRGDFGAANRARLAARTHQAEADLYRQKVEKARLLAPLSGVVVTPKVEEKVGKLVAKGEAFCEIVDLQHMAAEMNVPETEIDLVRPGALVRLKLNSFPSLTFAGAVERSSAQTVSAEGEQFFIVRAIFSNLGGKARNGMVGRGKISAAGGWAGSGWYPIGYVLLRTPVRWAWRKVWSWLP